MRCSDRRFTPAIVELSLTEDDDVVEQLASDRADEPFGEAVLPRRSRRDSELLEAHPGEPLVKRGAEDSVAIADDALGDALAQPGDRVI